MDSAMSGASSLLRNVADAVEGRSRNGAREDTPSKKRKDLEGKSSASSGNNKGGTDLFG